MSGNRMLRRSKKEKRTESNWYENEETMKFETINEHFANDSSTVWDRSLENHESYWLEDTSVY